MIAWLEAVESDWLQASIAIYKSVVSEAVCIVVASAWQEIFESSLSGDNDIQLILSLYLGCIH